MQDAVIRNFEIIGEATKQVDIDFREKYPRIEWKKIAGLRDKLILHYMGVDIMAIWSLVRDIIPEFEIQISAIIINENDNQ